MFGVLVMRPTIMKHEFGYPFIGEIFDQKIHKGKCRMGGNHRARFIILFQPPDNRGRVHRNFLDLAVGGEIHDRNYRHFGRGARLRSRHPMSVPAQNIGHAAKPQYRKHLSRIG